MGPALVSRIKVMANMNIVERRRPQDGQIEATVDGVPLDVRVSTTSTVQGEKCVLRILDKRRALFELSDLGMPPDIARGLRVARPARRTAWSSAPARPGAARPRRSTRR